MTVLKSGLQCIALALCASVATFASAAMITYDLALQATAVVIDPVFLTGTRVSGCPGIVGNLDQFGCDLRPGDIFRGRFAIDQGALAQTGDNIVVPTHDFILRIGEVVWDQTGRQYAPPVMNVFVGFWPFGLTGLGFDIHGGIVTGLHGGVIGGADSIDVTFFTNTFSAFDTHGTRVTGNLLVGRAAAVDAPSALALCLLGLAALGCCANAPVRKRASSMSDSA